MSALAVGVFRWASAYAVMNASSSMVGRAPHLVPAAGPDVHRVVGVDAVVAGGPGEPEPHLVAEVDRDAAGGDRHVDRRPAAGLAGQHVHLRRWSTVDGHPEQQAGEPGVA